MKDAICSVIGAIGAAIASAFGGWSAGMTTLVIFMAIDYITGLVVAAVFKNSPKTETGTLSSAACLKGLIRKGMMLLIVLIACRLDMLIGTNYIRDAVIIAFCSSELLSLVENAGLMGVPIPSVITKAIDILQHKDDDNESAGGSE